jgi:hypothetical protein
LAATKFPIGTLILAEPARTEAWLLWRAGLDLDALSYECQQTLPALGACLHRWLAGDDCAARIQGIVKMAWSRNQVRLHKAAELHETLLGASVAPVAIIGPLAWALLVREEGSIRTIPDLKLLIPRDRVLKAVPALENQGWELHSPSPDSNTLDWSSNLAFIKDEITFHLHWRLFPTSAVKAIEFENVLMEKLRPVVWNGHEFRALSLEAELLHRLTDRPPWDPVPWQADVFMMPFVGVDWNRLRKLADRFASFFEPVDPIGRLMELRRDWQLPIPEMALPRGRALPKVRAPSRLKLAKLRAWGRSLWRA